MAKGKGSDKARDKSKAKTKTRAKKTIGSSSKKTSQSFAGLKIPKSIRSSKAFKVLLGSGLGREILADALIAAAGAAAAALTSSRPMRKAMGAGSHAAADANDVVKTAAGAVSNVMVDVARSFLPAAFVSPEPEKRAVSLKKPSTKTAAKRTPASTRRPAQSRKSAKKNPSVVTGAVKSARKS